MLLGRVTKEATERYTARHHAFKRTSFYREAQGVLVSSLGIGTYLGDTSPETDQAYTDAVVAAIRSGINFIDTSLNYRNQHSERAIGQAIIKLTQTPKIVDRDEFAVCTKAGYIARAATPNDLPPEHVVGGIHSIAPQFLADQLQRSRINLGIETVDVLFLHNPETQLGFVDHEELYQRVKSAFLYLEDAVLDQTIQYYGVATWDGFRKPHALSVTRMHQIAREIAGDTHHFRFIELPFNLAMPEAYTSRHEKLNGEALTVLEATHRLGITVLASASILQGKLARDLPGEVAAGVPGLETDAQRAIQFARCTPGITTALVGMSRTEHVMENLAVARVPPLSEHEYLNLFRNVA